MRTIEILRNARKLIERPGAWTRGAYARDANLNKIHLRGMLHVTARCYCPLGALYVAAGSIDAPLEPEVSVLCEGIGGIEFRDNGDLVTWNDAPERTHIEVLDAFDRAIALAEQAP